MPPSKPARVGPWTTLLIGIAVFIVIYAGIQWLRVTIFSHVALSDPRHIVVARAATSILLIWVLLGATALVARLRGQSLRDLGWAKKAPLRGWLLAAAVIVFYSGFTFMGPMMKGQPVLTDWSLFRVGTAVSIGISAGICEETVFRGFVMTQARDGGAHWSVQMLLSAVLFGLAHIGWGGMTGRFDPGAMVGSVFATIILGLLLAGVYLVAKRSLMPAIVAHGAIDMVIEPWLLLFMVTGAQYH